MLDGKNQVGEKLQLGGKNPSWAEKIRVGRKPHPIRIIIIILIYY